VTPVTSSTAIGGPVGRRFAALRETAEANYAAWRAPIRPRIDVAMDTSSLANGAGATREALSEAIDAHNLAVDLGHNVGYGIQWAQPLCTITWPDGSSVLYGPVTTDRVEELLAEATGRVGAAAELAIGVLEGDRPGIPDLRDHPFFACEPRERRLLRNIGLIDPENIEHYIATGGYAVVARMIDRHMEPEAVRQTLIDASLVGRGGASFPAGVKLNFLAGAGDEERYMVCNADEGDPGAWVNRVILDGDPHLLIEGMTIAAFATAAPAGFIYIRDEYPLGIERVEQAIRDAEEVGLLGDHILGSDFSFQLRVIRGAGAYVCGDETGLLSSISDDRGMPRVKPPFPAQAGAFMKPSNVNNVETYSNMPFILRHGADWYRELGSNPMTGTRIFSFSGDVDRTGFMELPFGTPVADALDACGGIAEGGSLKAILAGGPLGSVVSADHLEGLPLDGGDFQALGAALGAGGIVFASDRHCVVHLNEMFAQFVEEESCGRCTTCHGGNQRMTEVWRRIIDGGGRREDEHNLELIATTLQYSNCAHGQLSPNILKNTLSMFHAEYDEHVDGHVCSTLNCEGLTRFVVVDATDPALEAAVAICPVDAFTGEPGARAIDEAACIRCGACTDLAPRGIARQAVPPAPRIVAL
jgi:NADH-quinone oxidoreductase subunit F